MLTLEISHVCPDIRVQCVDNHLAVCRSGNLYSAIDEARSWWCALPCGIVADVLGLGQEVKEVALVKLSLAEYSPLQELLSAVVECAVEKGKEDSSILAENVTVGVVQLAKDVNLTEDGVSAGCHCGLYLCMISVYMQLQCILKVQGVRNAMMYACGEGWAARLYNLCYKRHPSRSWTEDLLCKV